ncbi:cilia- and flagella-associated protein 276 [Suncus etruscus]|uniref:cilia- and flagella-associated protein 276 n=1 Tax=Suncus etruscus TaxID=109475 RepID=UPI002110DFAB|nr:cilia- and flagella-associated protein 276 [Suncus etruscus]
MPRTQDPFQRPTDDSGSHLGHLQTSKKEPPKNPTHLIQYQDPWDRLNSTLTVTSMRRGIWFFDPEVPKDDLDFRLAALYDHHTGSFKNKCEILLQKETIQNSHSTPSSRLQFPGEHQTPQTFIIQDNIKKWVSPKKESIHSIQGSIVSPHTAATNGGYSRKNDGGFFST